MNVLLATTENPFVDGGATMIVTWLEQVLRERGHKVDTLRFPFSDEPGDILEQMMALRLLDVSEFGDRLITVRSPSYLLKHPRKISWFIHHYRGAYDLWGTKYQSLPNTPEGDATRQAIISADNVGLRECKAIFCNSKVVQRRVKQYNQLDSQVLYPPLMNPEQFHCGDFGDYLLYFSRLTHHKRQWLAIEALRFTKTPVRLVLAGKADPASEVYAQDLRNLIVKYKLTDRVTLMDRWVSQEEKVQLFADCLAAIYFPFDEDSYGYPSLEAHAAGKGVLTTSDSGGTIELIEDGHNGLVPPADPELIGEAMDNLYLDKAKARQMGQAGAQRIKDLGIDWDTVVERLLA